MTWNDLAYRLVPECDGNEDLAGFLLWNHTCFPFGTVLQVARGLRAWARKKRGGWSECCMCGNAFRYPGTILLGGTCGEGIRCKTLDAALANDR